MIRRVIYRHQASAFVRYPTAPLQITAPLTSSSFSSSSFVMCNGLRLCSSNNKPNGSASSPAATPTTTSGSASSPISTFGPKRTLLGSDSSGTISSSPAASQVLDFALQTVTKRYNIPTSAADMKTGTVAAYKALGVLMSQYVTYLEKEGPSSPSARLAAAVNSLNNNNNNNNNNSSSSNVGGKNKFGGFSSSSSSSSSADTLSGHVQDEVHKASYTSLVSFLVRTLFSQSAVPLETKPLVEHASEESKARLREFMARKTSERAAAVARRQREHQEKEEKEKGGGDGNEEAGGKTKLNSQKTDEEAAAEEEAEKSNNPDKSSTNSSTCSVKSSSSSSSSSATLPLPEDLMITERHFPLTDSMRSFLSSVYHMPTHKMVPVLGASGKGLGKEFRDYFTGCPRVTLRFGKYSRGLYPGATLPGQPPLPPLSEKKAPTAPTATADIGTVAEITNVYEIAHPADHVLKASIIGVRVDGSTIHVEEHADVTRAIEAAGGARKFARMMEAGLGEVLGPLDAKRAAKALRRQKRREVAASALGSSNINNNNTSNGTAATETPTASSSTSTSTSANNSDPVPPPHISVDILLNVVVPPRRFVPEFDFYEERVYGPPSEGARLMTAKLLAIHSAASIARVGDSIYKMFTGKPLQIYTHNNPSIEMLARKAGSPDMVPDGEGPSPVSGAAAAASADASAAGGTKPLEKYPYEVKVVTMVYCFRSKEWAIDNVQNLL